MSHSVHPTMLPWTSRLLPATAHILGLITSLLPLCVRYSHLVHLCYVLPPSTVGTPHAFHFSTFHNIFSLPRNIFSTKCPNGASAASAYPGIAMSIFVMKLECYLVFIATTHKLICRLGQYLLLNSVLNNTGETLVILMGKGQLMNVKPQWLRQKKNKKTKANNNVTLTVTLFCQVMLTCAGTPSFPQNSQK